MLWAVARPQRIVPWVVSVGVHAGLIALGFLATWTVVSLVADEEPVLIQAEFDALSYDPLVSLESPATEATGDSTPAGAEPAAHDLATQLADLRVEPISLETDVGLVVPSFAPRGSASASFVGLTTTNARDIVYVIDASGSMIRSLQIVIGELSRSLERLAPPQRFAVIFFQRNEAVAVPPANLVAATPESRRRALGWIDRHVIPAGRSNPLAAIEGALRLKPDVIFLLSENITGSGQFEIDREDLLALLERLNPVDPDSGERRTRINCVQFLDPDPLDTLRRIAERHGGPRGYKFLSRAELGLGAP